MRATSSSWFWTVRISNYPCCKKLRNHKMGVALCASSSLTTGRDQGGPRTGPRTGVSRTKDRGARTGSKEQGQEQGQAFQKEQGQAFQEDQGGPRDQGQALQGPRTGVSMAFHFFTPDLSRPRRTGVSIDGLQRPFARDVNGFWNSTPDQRQTEPTPGGGATRQDLSCRSKRPAFHGGLTAPHTRPG
jgi:hypothetical protein